MLNPLEKTYIIAADAVVGDVVKFAGETYTIVSKELNTFGRSLYAFYLKPVDATHDHYNVRVSVPTLADLTVYRTK